MGVDMRVASGYGFVVTGDALERWFTKSHPDEDPDDYGTDELLDIFLEDLPLLQAAFAGDAYAGRVQYAVTIRQASRTLDFGDGFRLLSYTSSDGNVGYVQLTNAAEALYGCNAVPDVDFGWLVGGYIY